MEAIEANPVIDVQHEVVVSATGLAVIPEQELAKINATEASLAELKRKAEELHALGPITDKDHFKAVHDFIQGAVKIRTSANRLAKQEAAPYYQKGDEIIAYGTGIGEQARTAEKLLRPFKDEWEDSLELEKARQAAEAAARLSNRYDTLYGFGMRPLNGNYALGKIIIEAVEIKALPDDKWIERMGEVEAEYQLELEAKKADELAQQQERERQDLVAQQQENERLRLQKIDDDQKKLAGQLKKQRDTLIAGRVVRLLNAGFTKVGESYEYADYRLTDEAIVETAEENFEQMLGYVRQLVEKVELARQAQALADQKAAEKATALRLKEQRKADTDRQKRLAPDKKKLLKYLGTIIDVPTPEVDNDEAKAVVTAITDQVAKLLDSFKQTIDSL